MRQAGRYMPEYRAVRAQHTFLEMCQKPGVASLVTLDAQRIIGADAAIITDILLVPKPSGWGWSFFQVKDRAWPPPIRSVADIDQLGDPEAAAAGCSPVAEASHDQSRSENVPLIGFCRLYTLASYAIEAKGATIPHPSGHVSRTTSLACPARKTRCGVSSLFNRSD